MPSGTTIQISRRMMAGARMIRAIFRVSWVAMAHTLPVV
jgi:hypothetical protein